MWAFSVDSIFKHEEIFIERLFELPCYRYLQKIVVVFRHKQKIVFKIQLFEARGCNEICNSSCTYEFSGFEF